MESIIKTALNILGTMYLMEDIEHTKIPADRSTPDKAYFNGLSLRWWDSEGPFAFIGKGPGILVHIESATTVHNEIYNIIDKRDSKYAAMLGFKFAGPIKKSDIDRKSVV